MMNVGEFWGVVILQTLPILGLVPAEFLTCSCFARDSGVAAFLMGEYNLVLKDDKILDILSAKPFFARFGQMKRVIVENLICEMKRHNDTKRDSDYVASILTVAASPSFTGLMILLFLRRQFRITKWL